MILPGVVVATAAVVDVGVEHLHELFALPSDTTICPAPHVVGHPGTQTTRAPAQGSGWAVPTDRGYVGGSGSKCAGRETITSGCGRKPRWGGARVHAKRGSCNDWPHIFS